MSAVPNTNPSPNPERAEKFVAEYQQIYTDELAKARAAASTTQTEAWQANYAAQLREHRARLDTIGDQLAALAQTVKTRGSDEEDEKAIGDCKTQLKEERIRHEAWYARAVATYAEPAKDCRRIREDAIASAQAQERAQPLIMNGLAAEVAAILHAWPRVTWNDADGVLIVE